MFRILRDMPPGTVGVAATGKVTEDDYREVLEPALRQAQEQHRDLRLLYVLADEFDGYSPGAMWQDTKLWAKHLKGWERIAIVSDKDWLENAIDAAKIIRRLRHKHPLRKIGIASQTKSGSCSCPQPTTAGPGQIAEC